MTKQENDKLFIMVYNTLITEESDFHLTEQELYLYCLIFKEKNITQEIKTTVSLISDFSKVRFNSRKDRELKTIKDNLNSLRRKGVINFSNREGEVDEDFLSNDSIIISINSLENKAFTMLPLKIFELFQTMIDMYIYVAVARWSSLGDFNCDYDRWSRILDISRPTTVKKIREAVNKGIIYVNVGDYLDDLATIRRQKKQSMNAYSITPFNDSQKTIMTKKKEREILLNAEEIPYVAEDIDEDIEYGLYAFETYEDESGYNKYPEEDDYYLYMQVVTELMNKEREPSNYDKELIATARKRMRQMKNNPIFIEGWNTCLARYLKEYGKTFADSPY